MIFDNDNVKYNIILGTNDLSKATLKLIYSEGKMDWCDCPIPLHPPGGLDSRDLHTMEDMFFIQAEGVLLNEDWLDCYVTKILNDKYE